MSDVVPRDGPGIETARCHTYIPTLCHTGARRKKRRRRSRSKAGVVFMAAIVRRRGRRIDLDQRVAIFVLPPRRT